MPAEATTDSGLMTDLRTAEFTVLRSAISTRGTARILIAIFAIAIWATLAVALLLFSDVPLAVLLSFGVLVAGFEAVHALHVGAERIGRYVQVCYEREVDGPRWESVAMSVGPALPGGGVDPLFSIVFVGAAVLNMAASAPVAPIWQEWLVLATVHGGFMLRIVRARAAAKRQRSIELERFRVALLGERDSRQ